VKNVFRVLMVLAFLGCDRQEKIPEGIMSKQEMTEVLLHAHLIEARINQLRISGDSSKKLFMRLEDHMFDTLGVDSSRYFDSYNYYLQKVKPLEEIYQMVIDSLSLREKINKID